ncbi:MAG: MATE family efflux transporter [Sneathiella sp.]
MSNQKKQIKRHKKTASPIDLNTDPIIPTLIRLSLPNMLVMLATTVTAMAETAYIGLLGPSALAGIAVVFPIVILQQSFSNGAMGGGVSSAISRALGAKDTARAAALAWHALAIGLIGGLLFTGIMLVLGPALYRLLGANGAVLEQALYYSSTVFLGSVSVWLTSMLVSIIRGHGNMKLPSQTLMLALIAQALLGGALGLGIGPFPKMGMAGVALGLALAFTGSTFFLTWFLVAGNARIPLTFSTIKWQKDLFHEILQVGLVSCISPLQTILTVLVTTAFIGEFGREALAGYGIGARLEMILIPIAFGIGVACVPIVGMAIGSRNIFRARKVAAYSSLLAALLLGMIGGIVVFFPALWSGLFTADPDITTIANAYLIWSGSAYGFFGLGLCLLFASQGARKVLGPVLAGTVRLIVVAIGCWVLSQIQAEPRHFFMLVAAGMMIYGVFAAFSVYRTNWALPTVQPT